MDLGAWNMFKRAALLLTVVMFLIATLTGCGEEPFRLHIIANSDSKEDQSVKLKVRDAILQLVNSQMKKVKNKDEAEEYISANIQIIEDEAQKTLKKNNMDYGAKGYIGRFEFPEKTYGDKTYPAGEYDALRLVLGEGKGHNWWCVMFPPLCLMEIEGQQDSAQQSAAPTPDGMEQVQYTSFFGELFQNVFGGQK
jgi:stage II sporulation protein R